MTAAMSVAEFKTNNLLRKRSWWLLSRKGIYRKMLVVSVLPLIVNIIFWLLALMGGTALGISTHRLDHITQLTDNVSNGFLWLIVNVLVSGVVGVITDYAALEIDRSDGADFEPGSTIAHALSWRYVLGTIMISATMFVLCTAAILAAGVVGVAVAIACRTAGWMNEAWVVPLLLLTFAFGAVLMLRVYLPFAQTRLLMKDAIDQDRDWNLIGLMKQSRRMMRGFKMDLFFLYLSMWFFLLLEAVTAGVGTTFFDPYIKMNLAGFYENLRRYHALEDEMNM